MAGERASLDATTIASLLERTKQKGRGKALKTLLAEAQTSEKNEKPTKKESSSEDEAPEPNSSAQANKSNVHIQITC